MSRGQGLLLLVAAVAAATIGAPARADDQIGFAELGPAVDYAPAGMPDFDQRQRGWTSPVADESRPTTWTHDGPIAAAAALWWLDSRAEPRTFQPPAESDGFGLVTPFGFWDDHATSNVHPLVNAIARESDTNGAAGLNPPYYGTCAEALERALDARLAAADTPGRYTIHHLNRPTTDQLASAVRQERAVFLLIGLWQPYASGEWGRLGGHYVALQAADDHVDRVHVSDPFYDRHAPSFAPSLHNNAARVSHDGYLVAPSLRPGPVLRLIDYFEGAAEIETLVANFQNHNRGDCAASDRPWVPAAPLEAHIDLAFIVSPPEARPTTTTTFTPAPPTADAPFPPSSATPTAVASRRPDRQTPPPPLPTRTSSPTRTLDPARPTEIGSAATATAAGGTNGAPTPATPGPSASATSGAATPATPGTSPTSGPPPPGGIATATSAPTGAITTPDPLVTPLSTGAPGPGASATVDPGGAAPTTTPTTGSAEPATAEAGASATAMAGTAAAATSGTPSEPHATATPAGDVTTATPDGVATTTATAPPSGSTSPTPGAGTPNGNNPATTEPPATASASGTADATATPTGGTPAEPAATETVHPSPTRAPDRGDARPVRGGRLWLPMLFRPRISRP